MAHSPWLVLAVPFGAQAVATVLLDVSPLLIQGFAFASAILMLVYQRATSATESTDRRTPPPPPAAAYHRRRSVAGSGILSNKARVSPIDDESDAALLDYAERVVRIRQRECSQLVDACYLDSAASPPIPAALIHRSAADLTANLYSNPHSKSPSATFTASRIEEVRARIVKELFGISDLQAWELIFTSGATASLKLVGEAFDWSEGDLHHLLESHTSLAGIRDLASRAGAKVGTFTEECPPVAAGSKRDLVALPLQCNATGKKYDRLLRDLGRQRGSRYILVDAASYLSSSQRLRLDELDRDQAPDYIAFSFYKVFGYPTGLGGLLVKKSAGAALCKKAYYGGGTVDAIAPLSSWKKPRKELAAAFEDGTVNIHAILAVRHALDYYSEVFGDWKDRRDYVRSLTRMLHQRVGSITHGNGRPVVRIYTTSGSANDWRTSEPRCVWYPCPDADDQGPVLNFNVLFPSGRVLPPNEVDRLAAISNIHIRAGRHCNAGFVASALGTTEDELRQQYARGIGCDESSDSDDAVSTSLRVSLCLLNTDEDVRRLVSFIERFFRVVDAPPRGALEQLASSPAETSALTFRLSSVYIYPIKSCAGQQLKMGERWPLTRYGLEYDREWVLMDLRTGKGLSQKKHPRMALIQPRVERERNRLVVAIAGRDVAEVVLDGPEAEADYEPGSSARQTLQVCADMVKPRAHTSIELREILSKHLELPCTLARQTAGEASRHSKLANSANSAAGLDRVPLLFSNESPFLLINQASVDRVSEWMQEGSGVAEAMGVSAFASTASTAAMDRTESSSDSGYADSVDSQTESVSDPAMEGVVATGGAQTSSFRSNFVISQHREATDRHAGTEEASDTTAFVEDGASRFRIGSNRFGVLGQCRRCQMVCVDQKTGEIRPETFKTLARQRRNSRGRIIFGSHLVWLDSLDVRHGAHEGLDGLGSVEVGMPVFLE